MILNFKILNIKMLQNLCLTYIIKNKLNLINQENLPQDLLDEILESRKLMKCQYWDFILPDLFAYFVVNPFGNFDLLLNFYDSI